MSQKTRIVNKKLIFSSPGTTNWTVPNGVTSIVAKCWGAGGASSVTYANKGGGGGSVNLKNVGGHAECQGIQGGWVSNVAALFL